MAEFIKIIKKISNATEASKLAGSNFERLHEDIVMDDFTKDFAAIKKTKPEFKGKFEAYSTMTNNIGVHGLEVFEIWIFS